MTTLKHPYKHMLLCRTGREERNIVYTVHSFVVLGKILSLYFKSKWAEHLPLPAFFSTWTWQIGCSLCWFCSIREKDRPMSKNRHRSCFWSHPVGRQTKFKQFQRFFLFLFFWWLSDLMSSEKSLSVWVFKKHFSALHITQQLYSCFGFKFELHFTLFRVWHTHF